jgi:hypothetical protein
MFKMHGEIMRRMHSFSRCEIARRATTVARVRPNLLLIAVVSLFLLTGCGSESTYAISKAILLAVVVAMKGQKKLRFTADEKLDTGEVPKSDDQLQEDRHKGWFIFRRAELIGARHSGFDAAALVPLVGQQFDQVIAYLNKRLGPTGTLRGYSEAGGASTAPKDQAFTSSNKHHLDLANLAIVLKDGESSGLENEYLRDRHNAIRSIVWHAAGLHDAVWSQNGDGPVLNEVALDELLDRRLRSVERMRRQINGGQTGPTSPNNSGLGPWFDASRVRVFEYPYFKRVLIDPTNLYVPPAPPRFDQFWIGFDSETVQYVWVGNRGLATRFLPEPSLPSANWPPLVTLQGLSNYTRVPGPSPLGPLLDEIFQSRLNIWERAWLFCDHSIALTHLEALRFALERRGQGANFDNLVRPRAPTISGILGGTNFVDGKPVAIDDDTLWNDGLSTGPGDTGVFDNLYADYRDVQVGDHVILWNHHLYVSVTSGAWRLENAFITEIDVVTDNFKEDKKPIDPSIFMKPRQAELRLDGFGEGRKYPAFLNELFKNIQGGFAAIYPEIPATGDHFIVSQSAAKAVAIKWAPYTTGIRGNPAGGIPDDPWFVFLPRVTRGDGESPYATVAKMLEVIKYSVIDDPQGGDYASPLTSVTVVVDGETQVRDLTDGVFFPLFLPVVNGRQMSWQMYFGKRGSSQLPAKLTPIPMAAELVPGLFVRGVNQPMEVVRPRARP